MFYLPQSESNLCHGTFKENKFQSAAINRTLYLVILVRLYKRYLCSGIQEFRMTNVVEQVRVVGPPKNEIWYFLLQIHIKKLFNGPHYLTYFDYSENQNQPVEELEPPWVFLLLLKSGKIILQKKLCWTIRTTILDNWDHFVGQVEPPP